MADGDDAKRKRSLEAAVALNPYQSQAWIELGLIAEQAGEYGQAERSLLEAARVDKSYSPRWTLANYYFRRQQEIEFWHWTREALTIKRGDATALYRLCWHFSGDPAVIAQKAIPDNSDQLVSYLLFLLSERRLMAAVPVAKLLIPNGGSAHMAILLGYCDRLIEAREIDTALEIWKSFAVNGLLGLDPPAPRLGVSLSNGEFSESPIQHGFDWRIPSTSGVTVRHSSASKSLEIKFSGQQPESCNLILQYIPLIPSNTYRLRCHYETSDLPPDPGLKWSVYSMIGARPTIPASEAPGFENLIFQTGADSRLASLVLRYVRDPGTVRIKGSIVIDKVTLESLGGSPYPISAPEYKTTRKGR